MYPAQDECQAEGSFLKRLGLLAGAVLTGIVLLCTTAAGATAAEVGVYIGGENPRFEAESYSTELLGTSDTTHEYTFGAKTLKCPDVEFFGDLSSATSAVEFSTFYYYPWCAFSSGGGLTIMANGCTDVLSVDNSGPPYVGDFQLKCPTGQSYELVESLGGGTTCTYALPAQAGLSGIGYANTGTGKNRAIEVDFNLSGMKYTITGPKLICKSGTYENGTYTGTMTLRGSN